MRSPDFTVSIIVACIGILLVGARSKAYAAYMKDDDCPRKLTSSKNLFFERDLDEQTSPRMQSSFYDLNAMTL